MSARTGLTRQATTLAAVVAAVSGGLVVAGHTSTGPTGRVAFPKSRSAPPPMPHVEHGRMIQANRSGASAMVDVAETRVERREVTIPAGAVTLPGDLSLPEAPLGVVVFVHGSGSSRLSPRNVQVAHSLNRGRLGTLLFDLLTEAESHDRANVFDIPLLARRLDAAVGWLDAQAETRALRLGAFGASTGAAAALWAAAGTDAFAAVVSRGGRPDLAAPRLPLVQAPTLLIVGGADEVVLELNREALAGLRACEHRLAIVPGATHLFEEPGALERVAELARDWFSRHLSA